MKTKPLAISRRELRLITQALLWVVTMERLDLAGIQVDAAWLRRTARLYSRMANSVVRKAKRNNPPAQRARERKEK